jgi:CheY-like chemotaxis protein
VLVAADGVAGVNAFREHADEIVAVVLDLTMPNMSGDEALRQIRDVRPDVPILVTSGFPEPAAAERLGGPLTHFVQKPFSPAVLILAVQACRSPRLGET